MARHMSLIQPDPSSSARATPTSSDWRAAIGFIARAGVLFFGASALVYLLGRHSIAQPWVSGVSAASVLALAIFLGANLHTKFTQLSPVTRKLIPPLGLLPWNLALIAMFFAIQPPAAPPEIMTKAATTLQQDPVRQFLLEDMRMLQEQATYRAAFLTLAVMFVMGLAAVMMPAHWRTRRSGAVALALAVAGFAFLMGRFAQWTDTILSGLRSLGAA